MTFVAIRVIISLYERACAHPFEYSCKAGIIFPLTVPRASPTGFSKDKIRYYSSETDRSSIE